MKKVFAEMGIGNESFFSTEFEEEESEYRVPKFIVPEKIRDFYVRFWIGKIVVILSMRDGFKTKKKDLSKRKILFGIGGENA